jgi:RimJ/RimL family protein N-acetyltransferase
MLTAENATLRAPTSADREVLLALRNDVPLQLDLMALPRPNSPVRVDQWIESLLGDPNSLFFVIADRDNGECVGFVQLRQMDLLHGTGRLGIGLVSQARGRGIAGSAIAALERYAHEVFHIRKIVLEVLTTNAAAVRCYEKAGYTRVGVLRAHHYQAGAYRDVLIMERLIGDAE